MHHLHDHVARQLAEKVEKRKLVVWYDPRAEFASFVAELRGGPRATSDLVPITVGGVAAELAEYAGSMFEVRTVVEPRACGDEARAVVIYIPGCERDRAASVLLELERAGTTWEPQLKQLARHLFLQKFTQGIVDEMLSIEKKVTYDDLARMFADSAVGEPPSMLRTIFPGASGSESIIAAWLASNASDGDIVAKDAGGELRKLLRSHLGIEAPDSADMTKLRAITLRYVLAGEFRLDLGCAPPHSVEAVPAPKTKDGEEAVRKLAARLRRKYPDSYAAMADGVEAELGLRSAKLPPRALGSIDTFRFEEKALLEHCSELICEEKFEEALAIVGPRAQSFWLDRDVARKAQWEARRLMAELGQIARDVRKAVAKAGPTPGAWIDAYTADDGWYRLDTAHRRLETWIVKLDEEASERPVGVVRRMYEDTCHAMADGFTKVLAKAGWTVSGAMHQTRVYSDIVAQQPKPLAYFLVDAMRFEMGVEVKERLPPHAEISVRAAVTALPSITPVGMAALQPGASASFSVVEEKGELGARIDGVFLPDRPSRTKFASARVPKMVDIALDDLLSLQPSKLTKKLEGAQVVVVRSQEIDHAGEGHFKVLSRQVMDAVIDNLALAIRRLASAGVEYAVVSADHGHIFASERDESMRIDSPGGKAVEIHRRCWIGRGGTTPPGCVRVTANELGYDSDLDFVFPSGSGVFKAGGDLAFHHGGPSLQEMIVPVLTIRLKVRPSVRPHPGGITVTGVADAVTNRIFTVTLAFEEQLALGKGSVGGLKVRPLLIANGKQVGAVGMAVDADFDRSTGCVTVAPGKPVQVAFRLNDDTVASLRVVVQDPATDAVLYSSPSEIAVRLGV